MYPWRDGLTCVVEFDLPGVKTQDVDLNLDLDLERNVPTVTIERTICEAQDTKRVAVERTMVFTASFLWESALIPIGCRLECKAGVLWLTISVAEQVKPHQIQIVSKGRRQFVAAGSEPDEMGFQPGRIRMARRRRHRCSLEIAGLAGGCQGTTSNRFRAPINSARSAAQPAQRLSSRERL